MAIYLAAKIVNAISVAAYMVSVTEKRVNVNVTPVLRAEHVPKRSLRIIIQHYIKINLNLKMAIHRLAHMYAMNSTKPLFLVLANAAMPNSQNFKVKL